MKINLETLKRDLMSPLHKSYITHFPVYTDKISTFRKSPGCGKCISDIASMLSQDHSKWKFSKIYNVDVNDIELDPSQASVKSMTWEQKVEVHKVKRQEYESFVVDLYKIKQGNLPQSQIKSFNTFYEPITDRVVVTLLLLVPTMK